MKFPTFEERDQFPSPFSGSIMDRFFKDLESSFFNEGSFGQFGDTDIYERDKTLHFETGLPGVRKDDLKIRVQDSHLVMEGEISQSKETERDNYIRRGRRYGKFRRSFPLPDEIDDPKKIKAEFKNGILHVEVPLKKSLGEEGVVDVEIK